MYQITDELKQERLEQVISLQKKHTLERNRELVGTSQTVMVEKTSKRSQNQWAGRTDSNKWVIFNKEDSQIRDLVQVQITEAKGISIRGQMLKRAEAA